MRPSCPWRTTSASASITRTVSPHPAEHKVQILGFQVETPGTRSSSGMKRMSCRSGLPQASSAAVAPVTAESLMKSRRSMPFSKVTRGAVDGSPALFMTVQAETHLKVDHQDGYGLLRHVSMADLTIHARTNMWGVIETNMGLRNIVIDALPADIFTAREHRRHFLNLRFVFGDDLVASHADLDVGNARVRPGINANVAVQTLKPISEMDLVCIGDRLDRPGPAVEIVAQGAKQRAVSRSEEGGRGPLPDHAVAARKRPGAAEQRRRCDQQNEKQPRPAEVRLSRRMSKTVHPCCSHPVRRMLVSETKIEA